MVKKKNNTIWWVFGVVVVSVLIVGGFVIFDENNDVPNVCQDFSTDCLVELRFCQDFYNYQTTAPSGNAQLSNQVKCSQESDPFKGQLVRGIPHPSCGFQGVQNLFGFDETELESCLIND